MNPESNDLKLILNPELAGTLAKEFGTPLYVLSENVFINRIQSYTKALKAADSNTILGYATKANSTLAILKIAANQNLLLDVASQGELQAAIQAGVNPNQCYLHGNNKSDQEINLSLQLNLHHLVADNFHDLERIGAAQSQIPITIRLAPGVDPITHEKIRTGQSDTKFGFPILTEVLDQIAHKIKALNLNFIGFHCHVGSQLLDPAAQISGGELIARATEQFAHKHNLKTKLLNVGGGLGVAYTPDQTPLDFNTYNQMLCPPIRDILNQTAPGATLMQEPGRSLISDAGVTLYTTGPIKQTTLADGTQKTYVSVDGGLADNPRPALYHAAYTVLDPHPNHPKQIVTIAGRHCETDILFPHVPLSKHLNTGDILQVLCTGAYNSSMANNYNRYPRPATVLLRLSGEPTLIQQKETYTQMFEREIVPSDL